RYTLIHSKLTKGKKFSTHSHKHTHTHTHTPTHTTPHTQHTTHTRHTHTHTPTQISTPTHDRAVSCSCWSSPDLVQITGVIGVHLAADTAALMLRGNKFPWTLSERARERERARRETTY